MPSPELHLRDGDAASLRPRSVPALASAIVRVPLRAAGSAAAQHRTLAAAVA